MEVFKEKINGLNPVPCKPPTKGIETLSLIKFLVTERQWAVTGCLEYDHSPGSCLN